VPAARVDRTIQKVGDLHRYGTDDS
jgi:hypothetical protein